MGERPGQAEFRAGGIQEYQVSFIGMPLGCIVTLQGLLSPVKAHLVEAHHIISYCKHKSQPGLCEEIWDPHVPIYSIGDQDQLITTFGAKVQRVHHSANCILLWKFFHLRIHDTTGEVDRNTKVLIQNEFESPANRKLLSRVDRKYRKKNFGDTREHFLASKGLIPKVERGYT